MERHFGKRPIIYTNIEFYNAILAGGAFADYPIWVRSTKHNPAMRYSDRTGSSGNTRQTESCRHRRRSRPQRLRRDQKQWRAFLDGRTRGARRRDVPAPRNRRRSGSLAAATDRIREPDTRIEARAAAPERRSRSKSDMAASSDA